jgi:hypothetical protein
MKFKFNTDPENSEKVWRREKRRRWRFADPRPDANLSRLDKICAHDFAKQMSMVVALFFSLLTLM